MSLQSLFLRNTGGDAKHANVEVQDVQRFQQHVCGLGCPAMCEPLIRSKCYLKGWSPQTIPGPRLGIAANPPATVLTKVYRIPGRFKSKVQAVPCKTGIFSECRNTLLADFLLSPTLKVNLTDTEWRTQSGHKNDMCWLLGTLAVLLLTFLNTLVHFWASRYSWGCPSKWLLGWKAHLGFWFWGSWGLLSDLNLTPKMSITCKGRWDYIRPSGSTSLYAYACTVSCFPTVRLWLCLCLCQHCVCQWWHLCPISALQVNKLIYF